MIIPLLPAFEVRAKSDALAVRSALQQFLKELEPLNLDTDEAGTIEIVLAEILNNIVEHAYPASTQEGLIRLTCEQKHNGLHLSITDWGRPMPDGEVPLGQATSTDVALQDMPEGGFGWFLIHTLAKDVSYHRGDGANTVKLRLAIGLV